MAFKNALKIAKQNFSNKALLSTINPTVKSTYLKKLTCLGTAGVLTASGIFVANHVKTCKIKTIHTEEFKKTINSYSDNKPDLMEQIKIWGKFTSRPVVMTIQDELTLCGEENNIFDKKALTYYRKRDFIVVKNEWPIEAEDGYQKLDLILISPGYKKVFNSGAIFYDSEDNLNSRVLKKKLDDILTRNSETIINQTN